MDDTRAQGSTRDKTRLRQKFKRIHPAQAQSVVAAVSAAAFQAFNIDIRTEHREEGESKQQD
jgi:hypothetical protein